MYISGFLTYVNTFSYKRIKEYANSGKSFTNTITKMNSLYYSKHLKLKYCSWSIFS